MLTKHYPDGKVTDPDGNVTDPDGNVTDPDGNVTDPDGNVTDLYPSGLSGWFVDRSLNHEPETMNRNPCTS